MLDRMDASAPGAAVPDEPDEPDDVAVPEAEVSDAEITVPKQATLTVGMRLVRRMIRPHLGPFVTSIVGAAIFAGGTVGSTIVLGRVSDDIVLAALENGDDVSGGTVWLGVLAIVLVAIIRAVGVVARRYYAGMTSERVQRETREALADEYLSRPIAWHHTMATGRLLAHVDSDAKVLVHALHPLPFTLGVGFLAVFASITFLSIDPLIFAVAILIFPIMVLANRFYSRVVHDPLAEAQERVGVASSIAHESFEGALIVKSLGLADRETARFSQASDKIREQRVRVGNMRATFDAVLDTLPSAGILVVIVLGAWRVDSGAMSPGDIVTVASLFTLLAIPMRVFGFFLESLAPSVVAWERLDPIIGRWKPAAMAWSGTTDQARGPSRDQSDRAAAPVQVQNVSFSYPVPAESDLSEGGSKGLIAEQIIDDVSFNVAAGETLAIVGPTGSGKSTLCGLLAGVTVPDVGDVLVDGSPVSDLSTAVRSARIALVFQQPFVFADSVRSNVDLGQGATDDELRVAASAAQIDGFIDDLPVGWDTELGERGFTVSGGQRQRLALARALVRHPGLLILDDATSAVDSVIEKEILDGLRADARATTVIVAHRLSTILLADRVLFLRQGRVAGIGTHEHLLKDPVYANLVSAYSRESAASGKASHG